MRKKGFFLFAVLSMVVAFSVTAYAATDSEDVDVTATVPSAIAITSIPASLDLGVTVGSQITTSLDIDVKSNAAWTLTVSKDQDLTSAGDTISSADLVFDSSATGGFGDGVTDSPFGVGTSVISGGDPTGEAGTTVTVDYKLTTDFDDQAGAYAATHSYTAAAP